MCRSPVPVQTCATCFPKFVYSVSKNNFSNNFLSFESVVFLVQGQYIHQSTLLVNMVAKSLFYIFLIDKWICWPSHWWICWPRQCWICWLRHWWRCWPSQRSTCGLVTSEHVGQVTGEHVSQVTGELHGQVTGEYVD